MRVRFITFIFIAALLVPCIYAQSRRPTPTPTPAPEEQPEKVFTEEIRLNISAFDENGKFTPDVKKEDIVILEDDRLQQPDSLSHVPATVLLLLDTGGEERRIKGQIVTRSVAKSLINSLQNKDLFAVMEFNDKVKVLSEWTGDKTQIQEVLDKKLGFGKRSRLISALELAVKFMERAPLENRHIVLITDGIDSAATLQERIAAIKNVLASSVNVHVLSYTVIEDQALPINKGRIQKGEPKPRRLPEEVIITLPGPVQDMARLPRLGSISTDKEMIRQQKKRSDALKKAETELTKLSEDTNGEIFLPQTPEEMVAKTEVLAKNIDSQYTLTYTPKRPLNDVKTEEVRNIEARSRRAGLTVVGRRKLVVKRQ